MFATSISGVDTLALVEAVEQLTQARSLAEVSALVRTAARRILGADGVSFVIREGDLCHYYDEDAMGPLWKGQRFPAASCISGWAMIQGRTAISPDIYADERIPHPAYAKTFVRSLVMAPVRKADPLGAIGAYWAELRTPTEGEVRALETLAQAASAALAQAALAVSLADAQATLALALQAARLGSWSFDVSTGRFNASASCKAMLGYADEEALEFEDLLAAVHEEDRDRMAQAFKRAEEGEGLDVEFRVHTRTGTLRWMAMQGQLAPEGQGRPPVLVGVGQDVTTRRRFVVPPVAPSMEEFKSALSDALLQNAAAYRSVVGLQN